MTTLTVAGIWLTAVERNSAACIVRAVAHCFLTESVDCFVLGCKYYVLLISYLLPNLFKCYEEFKRGHFIRKINALGSRAECSILLCCLCSTGLANPCVGLICSLLLPLVFVLPPF